MCVFDAGWLGLESLFMGSACAAASRFRTVPNFALVLSQSLARLCCAVPCQTRPGGGEGEESWW